MRTAPHSILSRRHYLIDRELSKDLAAAKRYADQ